MTSKIKIKMGTIELEAEGTEEFLKQEIPEFLKTISTLHSATTVENKTNGKAEGAVPPRQAGTRLELSTGSIAAKLDSKSGPDLILAACARLELVLGKANYNRQAILDEMKTANSYFKVTYRKNYSRDLHNLIVNGKLVESAAGIYALHATARQDLEAQVGK